jgi:hypothetical protein
MDVDSSSPKQAAEAQRALTISQISARLGVSPLSSPPASIKGDLPPVVSTTPEPEDPPTTPPHTPIDTGLATPRPSQTPPPRSMQVEVLVPSFTRTGAESGSRYPKRTRKVKSMKEIGEWLSESSDTSPAKRKKKRKVADDARVPDAVELSLVERDIARLPADRDRLLVYGNPKDMRPLVSLARRVPVRAAPTINTPLGGGTPLVSILTSFYIC